MQSHLKMLIEEPTDTYQIVKFEGEFDKLGHSEIKDELEKLINNITVNNLIFDLKKLKFINSEGIGYLMEIHTHLLKNDLQLVLISPNAHVKDVFETIGLKEIIPLYEKITDFKNR